MTSSSLESALQLKQAPIDFSLHLLIRVQWTRGQSLYFPECLGWMHSHHYALVLHTPGIPGQYQSVPGSPSMCLGIPEYGIGYSDDTRQSRDIPPCVSTIYPVSWYARIPGTLGRYQTVPGYSPCGSTIYPVSWCARIPGILGRYQRVPGYSPCVSTIYPVSWYPRIPGILGRYQRVPEYSPCGSTIYPVS